MIHPTTPSHNFGLSGHHGLSWYVIHDLCAKFQLSGMNRSVSRTSHPQSYTWRTLKVPDWCLGGLGHPWHHGSSFHVILELFAKFQRSSIIRSVSRTPCPRSHTWRMLMVPEVLLGLPGGGPWWRRVVLGHEKDPWKFRCSTLIIKVQANTPPPVFLSALP